MQNSQSVKYTGNVFRNYKMRQNQYRGGGPGGAGGHAGTRNLESGNGGTGAVSQSNMKYTSLKKMCQAGAGSGEIRKSVLRLSSGGKKTNHDLSKRSIELNSKEAVPTAHAITSFKH